MRPTRALPLSQAPVSAAAHTWLRQSRHESFFIVNDFPDGVFSNEKAKRILAWEPHDELTPYFTRSRM